MKYVNRIWITSTCVTACLLCVAHWFQARPILAQQSSNDYYDGTFYIYASIDVDSGYNLNADSYMAVDYDYYEDIDEIEVDGYADQDGANLDCNSPDCNISYGDDYNPAEVQLYSYHPVPGGHEYGMFSEGYAYTCDDDGEGYGDCSWDYVGAAYAQINVAIPPPQISSISPTSVNQGDQGTLTIAGTNLVQGSGDQLTLNYSGTGMPFTLTGTPSSTTASFSYDFNGYSPGTYSISVTNTEGTSNSKSFTVNPPVNACSQSTVPNAVTLEINSFTSGNQSGTFTLSHPTATAASAATTVSYGPFSTPSSIASNIASKITRNYAYIGITAQANGPSITMQSWNTFASLSASSPGSISIGTPTSVSCVVLPTLACKGLFPDYDYTRTYYKGTPAETIETARQHITRKHILGTPAATPPNTVYVNPNGYPPSEMFIWVQAYNFTTVLLNPLPVNGAFLHKYSKITQTTPTGIIEKGFIGIDASGNDLYTNLLRLSPDRCRVNTSYPVAP